MIGTPKACVANDFRPCVKLSLWPFYKWILAPTKSILAAFDVGPGGSTLIKKTIKWGWAGPHFEFMLRLPRIPIGQEQGTSGFAKLALMKRL